MPNPEIKRMTATCQYSTQKPIKTVHTVKVRIDHQVIRTPRAEYRAPAVIRLQDLIRRPRPRVKLSRREIFIRDGYTCQPAARWDHDGVTANVCLP